MDIQIRSHLAASQFLVQQQKDALWDAIIILDSKAELSDFVGEVTARHLCLSFDDIKASIAGKRLVRADDIRHAIDFSLDSQRLLVSCRAGQSRSPAIAFLIAFERLGSQAAFDMLNPNRHIPNSTIVDLGSRTLENEEINTTFRRWQKELGHANLSDYYEEIEDEIDQLENSGVTDRITIR